MFELPENIKIENAKKAINEAKYQPGEIEEVSAQHRRNRVR
jgi:mercuric reductase